MHVLFPFLRSHGALLALGVLVSRAAPIPAARAALDLGSATHAILSQFLHRDATVREAAMAALSSVARTGPLPLPLGDSIDLSTTPLSALPQAAVSSSTLTRMAVVARLLAVALSGTAAAAAADEAADVRLAGAQKSNAGNSATAAAFASLANSGHAVEAAAACLGAIGAGELRAPRQFDTQSFESSVPPVALSTIAALLRLSPNRSEAVQFAVGAALVEICGGAESAGPHALVRNSGTRASNAALATVDGGVSDVPLTGFSGTIDRSAATITCSPDALVLQEASLRLILDAVLSGPISSPRASERAAAAVWLLGLVHGLGARSNHLRSRLRELHAGFMRLLGEKSAFVQV